MTNKVIAFLIGCMTAAASGAQRQTNISQVWRPDNGNGTYTNPVINADYSDPDAIRVGDDFYMTASSFDAVPGLPILHSRDLVNWKLIGHALKRQPPYDVFAKTQHGNGVWAPSIRYHKNEFFIYYPDPDFGIYMIRSKHITGPWSEPVLVEAGSGLIDPCPLWDADGKVYLVHAYAGSRAGIKSILVVKEMNAEGTRTITAGRIVFDGHGQDPTLEGPKCYKRNGYYYIFAPAGGVATGWQLVLRSKNIYGPYERKVVMEQGNTPINGPHQGAWVDTKDGTDWFLHFQDKGAIGRVVHLQPMKWNDNWPVIGTDTDNDGIGNPVLVYKKPLLKGGILQTPQETDEFNDLDTGLQWQWQANPAAAWSFMYPSKGVLRLFAQPLPPEVKNLWDLPNLLLQKFPGDAFTATAKMQFIPNEKIIGEKAGLTTMALNYAGIAVKKKKDGLYIVTTFCENADKGQPETETEVARLDDHTVYLRMQFYTDTTYQFSYSTDGRVFKTAGSRVKAVPGKWIGIKMGCYITSPVKTNDAGFVDLDWFRVTK
ncbi:glycoside hydrolase 43 family protein [Niabella sp. CC-SYL272]|uniref:glycoside hydrolase family 43 protein n=1 Tax=Niabella agricola TaxID=2891571 RepID=UPI001F2CE272|nr:glycoside hydrolase 43 family protein [Niabella agricola]MCF3109691.1 glycoside hydrolase 43 family protein [Niabella agricola]